ncbi:response regulator [Pseudonocardia humida]|uniref:Response regulator n=1 Tax=Pseudonocardia humida TaxID=2800819 RepID=A0ABT0ZT53_9PSEU|nr:response regulator [Pseudonocardia humida]MCO1653870.1 response regulator [Pseudonocardia humida]
MRVLVVDDDEDNVEVLVMCLTAFLDWDVRAVTDGREALEICWSTEFDVVVLDVEMPLMDGPHVLAALRADPRTTSLPVVFLTANAEPALGDRLQALGALAVLAKPFDTWLIGEQLAEFLGGR